MRFGLFTSMGAQTWSGVLDLWRHIERTGSDVACVTDHFLPNTKEREGAMLESWSTLSALAALVPGHARGHHRARQHVPPSRRGREDGRPGGHHLRGPAPPRTGRGLAGKRAPGLRDPVLHAARAAGASGRGVPGHRGRCGPSAGATSRAATTSCPTPPWIPSPSQTRTRLMIGGGGERVTLRIVAKHADHWNVWGGPKIMAKKGAILDEHCAAVGRDAKSLTRSANMALLITDKKQEVEQLADTIAKRMGRHAEDARDTCLAGTPDQIRSGSISSSRPGSTCSSSRACSGLCPSCGATSIASSETSPRRSGRRRGLRGSRRGRAPRSGMSRLPGRLSARPRARRLGRDEAVGLFRSIRNRSAPPLPRKSFFSACPRPGRGLNSHRSAACYAG